LTAENTQQIWDDYYKRIRRRRIREARIVYAEMSVAGVTDSTFLALDFCHFGREESDIRSLAAQLSEHYATSIARSEKDGNYWMLDCTTRPEGIDEVTEQRWIDWVAFMCDVAQSYCCVFSTWSLTDTSKSQSWSNEEIDIDPEAERE
jgi:hypothetical protein